MRTTVELPDDLLKRAKREALERGSTLKQFIIRGLEEVLGGPELLQATHQPTPEAGRLPKVPPSDRAAYPLSPHEINAILSAEDAAPDRRSR
jgi:hypothetical protein